MISEQEIDQVVAQSIEQVKPLPKDLVLIDPAQSEERKQAVRELLTAQGLDVEFFSCAEGMEIEHCLPEARRYWLDLSDEQVVELFKYLPKMGSSVPLALLPNDNNKNAQSFFGITRKLKEAVADGVDKTKVVKADLLMCNGQIVLASVVLGEKLGARAMDDKQDAPFWKQAWLDWKETYQAVKRSTPQLFKIKTGKKQSINTAALSIWVEPHSSSAAITRGLETNFNFNDGRMNAVIFAPNSLMGYGWHWFKSYVLGQRQLTLLADTFGLVQSNSLRIKAQRDVEFFIDNQPHQAQEIKLDVREQAIHLIPGRLLADDDTTRKTHKEVFKVQGLPRDADAIEKVGKPLPLFDQAHEEDYKHVFVELRQSALTTSPYMVLMVLSTLLATFGLMANSTSVVIGAMILAPLMAPIVSLAMGMARGEGGLTVSSIKTLLIGLFLALMSAMVATWIVDIQYVTNEIAGRLNPTLLDLGVAVVSGIAGAYAYAKSEVAKTLAGVAIAVALVPPLAVTGIGLGWMDWSVIYGSFLLFITNLFGIAAGAAITFWVMGYTSFARAKKGFGASTLIVGLLAIPLAFAFWQMDQKSSLTNSLEGMELVINDTAIRLESVDVQWASTPSVKLNVVSSQTLSDEVFDELAEALSIKTGVEAQYRFTPQLMR
ncbi:TIGR00341 family protein [Thiomicrospira microaerophila]|uniref:TIGR00341 family protein n=1 Tax=Thiomicrospira microaerophila TaxID=406020 RepID=UPI000696FF50|nr:TIGR00341 family protein [Thiomicrospira microaerophila]